MSCNCKECGTANCITMVPIFNSLTDEEMMEVASITTGKKYDKGELVYQAGDKHQKLYVIHIGRIKIYRISPTGKEQVIRVLGPGEFMGELSLFSSMPTTDYAEVIEPCNMCMIDGTKLKELMKRFPIISFKVMEELSKRLEQAENLIEDISLHSVEQRLAQVLLKLADSNGQVILSMKKGDFASQLGMTQETLSRKLTLFQDMGLIRQEGQRIIKILDLDRLNDIHMN